MANENIAPTDANSQPSGAAPSPAPAQSNAGSPPAESKSVPETKPDSNAIPYTRFSEVVRERNEERRKSQEYEARLRQLEAGRPSSASAPEDVVSAEAKRLAERLKMSPEAAREVAESASRISNARASQIEQRQRQQEVIEWTRRLAEKHSDYSELEPLLDKEFSKLGDEDKAYVASSPQRLEMFYSHVKGMSAEAKVKEAFEKGASEAYKNQAAKTGVSSVPGTASQPQKGQLTLAAIRAMSSEDYVKRLPEINDAIKRGILK